MNARLGDAVRRARRSTGLDTAVKKLVGHLETDEAELASFLDDLRIETDATGSVRSRVTARLGDGIPAAANPSLRRGQLGDQRTPAREEESPLLGQRDVSLAAAADPEVLAQLIERRAES